MDNHATVSINLHDGSIVISGSEDFIEKTMKVAFDFVEKNLSLPATPSVLTTLAATNQSEHNSKEDIVNLESNNTALVPSDDKYIKAGVYHIDADDGSISILKKVPGDNKAEKTKNIALIVLFIKKEKFKERKLSLFAKSMPVMIVQTSQLFLRMRKQIL